jgi:murein DD-endopeptidase MepM/ murein hydrolase activator NlpD
MSRLDLSPGSSLRRSVVTLVVVGALVPATAIAAPVPQRGLPAEVSVPETVPTASTVALTEQQLVDLLRATAEPEPEPEPKPEPVNEEGSTFATVAGQPLTLPDGVVGVGFHESGDSRALPLQPVGSPTANHNAGRVTTPYPTTRATQYVVLPTRRRVMGGTTAVDLRVHPDIPVTAPVTGTVDMVRAYALYGRHKDVVIEIVPDDNPHVRVRLMHVRGVSLQEGTHVTAGESVIAEGSRQLPFSSQIDRFSGNGPHIHLEVHANPVDVAADETSDAEVALAGTALPNSLTVPLPDSED